MGRSILRMCFNFRSPRRAQIDHPYGPTTPDSVIFTVNLTNVFLLAFAPDDLSAINAPFASMITALLVARLMFNLRAAADNQSIVSRGSAPGSQPRPHASFNKNSRIASTFNAVGQTTTFLGRMGTDEFSVPLPDKLFSGSLSDTDTTSEWVEDTSTVEEYEML
ncbi:hypothetical protein CVT24_011851 [Panaeolus cyanescens]|uniref:Uncharacterized protein n=1 Tax=Panaeolus cyanescens TaxID=181874 RepID=A0A409YNW1_9AGAR|nr:hypothetical protein CVT24_011851 [Panaeolus cyanescens]